MTDSTPARHLSTPGASVRAWTEAINRAAQSHSAGSARLARHRASLLSRLGSYTSPNSKRGSAQAVPEKVRPGSMMAVARASGNRRLAAILTERRRIRGVRESVTSVVSAGRHGNGRVSMSRRGTMSNDAAEEEALLKEKKRRRLEQLIRKFRFIVRFTQVASLYCREHFLTCERLGYQYREQAEEIDRVTVLGINKSDQLFFDRADFVANKQMRMPTEARRILMKRPALRTEEEINYAVIALRSVKSIADYPVRMQTKLAQFGMLETFSQGRVIVKEGQAAQAFYFLIFGTVLVAVLNPADDKAETVCYLQRGDSFGELAIVNRSHRQSTVISKTEVDLLSISVETYESVFMVGGRKNINDPDHNQFIDTLHFLRGWPTELLSEYPDRFVFSYFKRGAVMVKDSMHSKWIYIVKSGSVSVLKKLSRVKPKVSASSGSLISTSRPKSQYSLFHDKRGMPSRPRSAWGTERTESPEDDNIIEAIKALNARNHVESRNAVSISRPSTGAISDLKKKEVKTGRRTFIDDLEDFDSDEFDSAKRMPEFVRVQTLLKGAAFGLQHLFCDDQPSMCLVSNGAECLMLDRKFYIENCPSRLRDKLRNLICPYPSPGDMQEKLEVRVNWDAYRQVVLQQVLQDCGRSSPRV